MPPEETFLRKFTRPIWAAAGTAVPKFGYFPSMGPCRLFNRTAETAVKFRLLRRMVVASMMMLDTLRLKVSPSTFKLRAP